MKAGTTGWIQCKKCNAVYEPALKVLERVCPQCLSMKTVKLDVAPLAHSLATV